MSVSREAARLWAEQAKHPENICSKAKFFWHQVLPQFFCITITPKSIIFFILKLAAVLIVATSPFWIDFFEDKSLSLYNSVVYGSVILAAMLFLYYYQWSNSKHAIDSDKTRHEGIVSLRQTKALRSLFEIVNVKRTAVNDAKSDHVVRMLLGCAEQKTRSFLSQYKESYFQVTLLIFLDGAEDRLFVKMRAYPNRQEGIEVDAYQSAAYYVARANRPSKAIHDLKNDPIFPYKGLSESDEPPYRSVLLIPITLQSNGNGNRCLGVVSIDAAKPYEFWGPKGYDLAVQLQPYIQLVGLLLDDGRCGIKV